MSQVLNFASPRVFQLMKLIEIEQDRDRLEQLFMELNTLLNDDKRKPRPSRKSVRSIVFGQGRRKRSL